MLEEIKSEILPGKTFFCFIQRTPEECIEYIRALKNENIHSEDVSHDSSYIKITSDEWFVFWQKVWIFFVAFTFVLTLVALFLSFFYVFVVTCYVGFVTFYVVVCFFLRFFVIFYVFVVTFYVFFVTFYVFCHFLRFLDSFFSLFPKHCNICPGFGQGKLGFPSA